MAWNLEEALPYLSARDARMAATIEEIGGILRQGEDDLFIALTQSIIGQQISLKAADTVWQRLTALLPAVTPEAVAALDAAALQGCGMSLRKAEYILGAARTIVSGELDLNALKTMEDEAVIRELVRLRGVGRWTAEMLLIFSLRRQDVMSYDDYGLRSGLCKLYHHQDMPRPRFERYRRRFHPYGTAASLVLWAIAGGQAAKACALPIRQKNG